MYYVNVSNLQQMNGIYVHHITEGMHEYLYYVLEGTMDQHYALLAGLASLSESQSSFGDFYYKRINSSNIELIKKQLTTEESALLDKLIKEGYNLKTEEEFLLVELTEDILKLLLKISYQEYLFSSFYFTHLPCTIWSNYKGRFILFAREQEQCDQVLKLANEIGLLIEW